MSSGEDTVRLKNNPNKRIGSISVLQGMFGKLKKHGLHLPSFLDFQMGELKEKVEEGYSIPDEYFMRTRSKDRQKESKTFYLDKGLMDWTGGLKKTVNGRELRFNRSRYLGDRLMEMYYTLHYDGSTGRLINSIGKTLEELEEYMEAGEVNTKPLKGRLKSLWLSLESLRTRIDKPKEEYVTDHELKELFGRKIDYVASIDEKAADILEEKMRGYYDYLKKFFLPGDASGISGAYGDMMTEVRYALGKDVELGRALAGDLPRMLTHPWAETRKDCTEIVNEALRDAGDPPGKVRQGI
jgi:hypothetical protein